MAYGKKIESILKKSAIPPAQRWRFMGVAFLSLIVAVFPGCLFHHHSNKDDVSGLLAGQQPDKLLYEKSIEEIDHGRYDVGRLTLQALLNTYPDSEYLAKAKLAIANSYYQQGGASGLTESEAEYKDFITFFPTAPEAPMAQYRVGMAHFRLMGKSDRDLTQAKLAEAEFKEFLLRYSDSLLMPRVKAHLREVQEVLARGDYDIAHFYYENHANLAARSRFEEIVERYPNFSEADRACWYLADTYKQLRNPKMAVPYYKRIITDYPLSSLVPDAKEQLTAMHQPIPSPTKATLARAHADAVRQIHPGLMQRLTGVFSSAPNLQATRHGPVILSNESNQVEMAKSAEPAGVSENGIAVHPASDSALKSGEAVDPKDSETTSAKDSDSKNTQEKAKSLTNSDSAETPSSKKKGGRFHFVKKVIKPF